MRPGLPDRGTSSYPNFDANRCLNATSTPPPIVAPADAGWIVLAPPGSGFTSRYPGQPKLTKTTTTTKEGLTPTSVWEYLASTDLDYNVAMWEYPSGSTAGMAASAIYDSAIASMDSTTD